MCSTYVESQTELLKDLGDWLIYHAVQIYKLDSANQLLLSKAIDNMTLTLSGSSVVCFFPSSTMYR